MREVIMHAQPSSGKMRPIFSQCVRPNAACLRRPLHIVDNIICLCYYRGNFKADMCKCLMESDLECSLFQYLFLSTNIICPIFLDISYQ